MNGLNACFRPLKKGDRSHSCCTIFKIIIILLILQAAFLLGDCMQYEGGRSYTISGPLPPEDENYSYLWRATGGSPLINSSSSFQWTAPLVTEPTEVSISLFVSSGADGCTNKSELKILVVPSKKGEITLEKSLDSTKDPDNIEVGDMITYTVTISNTGETDISFLPLVDIYPDQFLKAIDSVPKWNGNGGSSLTWDTISLNNLTWNNLLKEPLVPGGQVTVSTTFQVIGFIEQIMNQAVVEGAKDDRGNVLDPQEADYIIAPIHYECPSLGPDTACVGEKVHFSSPLQNLPSYQWEARDENGNPVGGFNDTTSANVTWTAPGPGNFMISFNNLLCSQTVTARSC
jgi:uncharacterized repeat protein (TIGR01451 family)